MKEIIVRAIGALLSILMTVFPTEEIKKLIDMMLDKVEDMIKASPSAYDDAAILPLIGIIRSVFSIPDND